MAEHTWIIGDTPRDLACAQALGLRCARSAPAAATPIWVDLSR